MDSGIDSEPGDPFFVRCGITFADHTELARQC